MKYVRLFLFTFITLIFTISCGNKEAKNIISVKRASAEKLMDSFKKFENNFLLRSDLSDNGYEKIKFSLLSAAEMVNPKQKSSVEADEISKHFKNNETLIVEGPLSLDISLNKNIAQEKKYAGNIQGDADVLVVPDIVSGNGISKSLILMAEAKMAGLILGATVPIVLTSRSASDTEKKYSLILALLADKEN